ncbi:MAG TPA: CcmD family protein [Bryobacteraceae bacterium]|nr:CcmD family protein [Bryobacteraceae bacterium]
MHWLSPLLLLAQVSADDITREMGRLQRNFEFLSYGFAAAWIVLAIYVLMMVGRERRLKREISSLKAMLEERQKK